MNKTILSGRLTADPEVRFTQGESSTCVARWTLAVERKFKNDSNTQNADFIRCVAFGKLGEHAEKYYRKGLKINVIGRIQTGSYKNKDGQTVFTTDVVVEDLEFAESKSKNPEGSAQQNSSRSDSDGFMKIPENIDDELPFS